MRKSLSETFTAPLIHDNAKNGTSQQTAESPTPIEVDHVSVAYDLPDRKISVVEDLSFDVKWNEFLVIMAPSGAGKSTLLRLLAGLEMPLSGEVRIKGNKVQGPRDEVFMVFQNFALFPWKTVLQNVELALHSRKKQLARSECQSKASDAINKVGLGDFANVYPGELSGGMRQRVGIARALALEPEIILLDEPFSSIDPVSARRMRKDVYSMVISPESPIRVAVMVTHNVEGAVELADRVLVLTKSPMKLKQEIKIDLRRPRRPTGDKFHGYVETIYDLLS